MRAASADGSSGLWNPESPGTVPFAAPPQERACRRRTACPRAPQAAGWGELSFRNRPFSTARAIVSGPVGSGCPPEPQGRNAPGSRGASHIPFVRRDEHAPEAERHGMACPRRPGFSASADTKSATSWLKDRKDRRLAAQDVAHYQKIVVALKETIRIMAEIDQAIEAHGGWPAALEGSRSPPPNVLSS